MCVSPAPVLALQCWSSSAGLGPPAELPGITQGARAEQTLPCSGSHSPKAGPATH